MLGSATQWREGARRSLGRPARALEPIGVLPPVLAELLAAVEREAKETAWAAFLEVYTPLLLRTAYRFGHTYDGAMDRYTYLLDHLYRNDFRRLRAFAAIGPGRFTTWLVVVARRLFLDYHRERYGRDSAAYRPGAKRDHGVIGDAKASRRNGQR